MGIGFRNAKKVVGLSPGYLTYTKENTKVKVLKVKFQNLGENGAESHFVWEPKSGSFIPNEPITQEVDGLPWE